MRAILTYHSIDRSGSPISVPPDVFARHVRWLASGRVRVVPLDALGRNADAGTADTADMVAITFDDGFTNFATEAAPRLLDHGLPVTLFVVSGHVGRTNAWGGHSASGVPTLTLLDWDALGRLAEAGVSIGAHTRSHRPLDTASPVETLAEVVGAAEDIAASLGRWPTSFAYPYGIIGRDAVACVRRHFAVGVTTEMRVLRGGEDVALLPRLDSHYFQRWGRLESWGSPAFRAHLWLRTAARMARARLRRPGRVGAAIAAGEPPRYRRSPP